MNAGTNLPQETSDARSSLKLAFERTSERVVAQLFLTPDKLKAFLKLTPPPIRDEASDSESTELSEETQNSPSEKLAGITAEEVIAMFPEIPSDLIHLGTVRDIVSDFQRRIDNQIHNPGVTADKDVRDPEPRRIAKGIAPQDGRDGKLLLLVKRYQNPRPGATVEFVDPRFMRTFDNIEKGAIVGRLYAETSGVNGRDVLGNELKAKAGKSAKIGLGDTLSVHPSNSPTFQNVIAETSGYLTEESNKWTVKEELVIHGDVGYRTGDIDFIGTVSVKGDVQKDFAVTARKDIHVKGNAVNSRLISYEGSIRVGGHASGALLTFIQAGSSVSAERLNTNVFMSDYRAGGEFHAQSVQGASIETVGDMYVKTEISHSLIRTRGLLHMPSGHLFGGQTYVVCGLEARLIGTKSGSLTTIALCSDIESSAEFGKLLHQVATAQTAENVLQLHLGPYAENPARLALLKEPLQSKQKKLFVKLQDLRRTIAALEEQRKNLLSAAVLNPILRVNFHERIFAGVVLKAGSKEFVITQDLPGPGTVEYLVNTETFVVREMLPLICTIERNQGSRTSPEKVHGEKPEKNKEPEI